MASVAGGAAFKQPVTLPVPLGAPPPPSAAFTPLSPLATIPQGLSSFPSHPSGPLVIIRAHDVVHALHGRCPHRGGELALGDVDIEDTRGVSIVCPRHRKKFPGGLHIDACSGGVWCGETPMADAHYDPSWRVPVFATSQVGEWLFVALEATGVKGSSSCSSA